MTGSRALPKQIPAIGLIFLFAISHSLSALAAPKSAPPSAPPSAPSQDQKFELTIDNIMRGPGLVGYEQTGVRWSPDSQHLYFQWKQYNEAREKDPDTYVVNRDGTGLRKLSEEEARNAPPPNGDESRDKKL